MCMCERYTCVYLEVCICLYVERYTCVCVRGTHVCICEGFTCGYV